MPIYEYKCLKCHHEFEAVQKFSDAPVCQCSVCGGPVKKLISRSSFHLKGSGWYLTDYAKKNGPTDSKSSSETSSSSKDTSSSSDSD
ncbi:MAG: Zinc ribbon domain protein [Deltaproteobacteria bacterium ADurb.BinA179]|jgi:putative FmdB family regulatory protein|nr:zinc ribbon domain-containing protein [Deltaproteobacteria bacterium]MDI9543164.1 zinc ribbon domain-containing protein [Pseudomonadota bacterium]NLW66564.1 zinc ribbon domain-containing protein [Bacteriovoracaceae bacterium]OPZ25962.1 MAG: Zinc ribbon domain protein [Deltaproteobacteria bacterium ADurb.BinA179]HRR21055.1 zinc ribbon domain-containing protein [Desulfomonilia bacterium]